MVAVEFQASASTVQAGNSLTISDDGATPFTFTSAQIHLRDIELDLADGDCDDVEGATCSEQSVKIEGPFVVDLLTGVSTPSLADVRVPAGIYKRIDFRIDDARIEQGLVDAASPLANRSMVASASFQHDGETMSLDLLLRFNEDIRVEDPAGIDVSGDAAALLTRFDASLWLDGLDIEDCLARGELAVTPTGVRLDDNASSGTGGCSDIENVIKRNIKTAAQLDRRD